MKRSRSSVAFRVLAVPVRTRRTGLIPAIAALLVVGVSQLPAEAAEPSITNVSVSRPFFDPTRNEKVVVSFVLERGGKLDVSILDRDGYVVRRLKTGESVPAGDVSLDWNGRFDNGEIAPDEAYSLKIDVQADGRTLGYFPAARPSQSFKIADPSYDRLSGVLTYKLPSPSRVHVQAGVSSVDPKTGKRDGPVLRTIANREPRPEGAVVETWTGWDETETINIADLPYFAIAVAASSLPENALITVGNSQKAFVDYVMTRAGVSLLKKSAEDHSHHRGLTTLDDVSPRLRIHPTSGKWAPDEKTWLPQGTRLECTLVLEGRSAAHFAKQPGDLVVFVNEKRVRVKPKPMDGERVEIALPATGSHIIAFNWVSQYGPVAANAILVQRSGAELTGRLTH